MRISSTQGKMRMMSKEGKGIWRKNPILTSMPSSLQHSLKCSIVTVNNKIGKIQRISNISALAQKSRSYLPANKSATAASPQPPPMPPVGAASAASVAAAEAQLMPDSEASR